MIFCCTGCVAPKRHAGCHATCEEYIKQRKEYDEQQKKIRKSKMIHNRFYDSRVKTKDMKLRLKAK